MFYEIRRYIVRSGRRDEWVRYMEQVVLPYQTGKGVDLVASFVDLEDDDAYVWIRRFDDDDSAARIGAAVYQDRVWVEDIGPKVRALLDVEKSVITRVARTPGPPAL